MKKAELAQSIATDTKVSLEKTTELIDAISEKIIESLVDDLFVYLDGLGIFWCKLERERRAADPRTGQEIVLPAKRWPTFTSGKPSGYAKQAANRILEKHDLIQRIIVSVKDEDETSEVFDSYLNILKATMDAGERVTIEGFGTFSSLKYPRRELKDPDTGETFSTEPETIYSFNSGKDFKERLN